MIEDEQIAAFRIGFRIYITAESLAGLLAEQQAASVDDHKLQQELREARRGGTTGAGRLCAIRTTNALKPLAICMSLVEVTDLPQ